MFEQFGVQLLSYYFFHPFLQQEGDRKKWMKERVRMLTRNIDIDYEQYSY